MPGFGRMHIVSQTMRDIYRIFADMGFQVYRSPEVETDENNFGLLNIPAHHPARDMWDTYHTTSRGSSCARTPRRGRCASCKK
jgi:phenylalanyl-tRNA synthetase alpha chain